MNKTVVKISHIRKNFSTFSTFISSCYFVGSQYFRDVVNGGNKFFTKGDLNMRKVLLATTALSR